MIVLTGDVDGNGDIDVVQVPTNDAGEYWFDGLVVPGPAIVGEMDSTTVILPGHIATVDDIGNLLINPTNEGGK